MEGNTLTMEETRSVMVGNVTIGGKPIKDVLEVKGHDEVISSILRIGKGELRLSEARIKEIHKGIMHEDDPELKKQIGIWKTHTNYIINYRGERFDFVAPIDVPEDMHDLLNRTNAAIDAINANKKDALHPLDVALNFHLEYVVIHPFFDGNGRTARILTNLLLISFGFAPFWIKENERKSYNQYLADIQGYGGEPNLFYELVASAVLRSQQMVLNAIEGKDISDDDDIDKLISTAKATLAGSQHKIETHLEKEVAKLFITEIVAPAYQYLNDKTTHFEDHFIRIGNQIDLRLNQSMKSIGNDNDLRKVIGNILVSLDKESNLFNLDTSFSKVFIGFKHNDNETYINIGVSFTLKELNAYITFSCKNTTDLKVLYKKVGGYDFNPVKKELDNLIKQFIEEMMNKKDAD